MKKIITFLFLFLIFSNQLYAQTLIQALKDDCLAVSKLLGATDLFMYDLPDNRFDTVPLLEIVKIIEDLIKRVNPHSIYTHHIGDLNIDHSLVCRATLTAARPLAASAVRDIYSFEIPSSTDWTFHQLSPVFRPNVFVDISKTLETKVQAMELYKNESRHFPHPRSPESLRAIARRWGSTSGLHAAEAFELIRSIRNNS